MTHDDESVDRSLAVLTRGIEAGSWPRPGELKRTAQRRRRTKLGGLIAAGAAVATAVTVAVVVPRDVPRDAPRKAVRVAADLVVSGRSGTAVQLAANAAPLTVADPSTASAVARAEQAFTLALLKQTNKAGGHQNVVLSPSSLAIALAMLQNGAAGSTREEISAALGTSSMTAEQQDAGWAALMSDLAKAGTDAGIDLQSANSLWLQHKLPLGADFMAAMARYFRTGVWQVDFQRDLTGAERAINAWCSAHTRGRITKLFGQGDLDDTTLLVLANAVYFKAAWQHPFDPKVTAPAPFYRSDGSTSTPQFMSTEKGPANLAAVSTPGYDAVQLPYQGGRFAALVVMPKGQDLAPFVNGLTADRLHQISTSLREQPASLRMPRFGAQTYTRLDDTLKAMGMPRAFTGSADFSRLSPVPMKVQSVVQRDVLRVGEQGTEAAAATGISMKYVSGTTIRGLQLTIDHPFLFLVRDTRTGAVLFAAQVQDPTG
ncbi:MAG: hypothetical protein DLM57_19195 [Pseudonocardiales bacterium]|nr:MAG: hypothetical protein DLM57_19195 [Pseudonocardiales bacterium]